MRSNKVLWLTMSVALAACGDEAINYSRDTLSTAEADDIRFTREEEKLARDVYAALGERYDEPVWGNIGASESRHFASMETLISGYGLVDPVTSDEAGRFANGELQGLYNALVAQGQASHIAALQVGCAIEELDIRDIEVALARTDESPIIEAYQNLLSGSHNHLRSFHGKLTSAGGTYTPVYISQAAFDAILAGK